MTASPTDSRLPPQRLTCARCGAAFECGATGGACWCMDETYRVPMPDMAGAECLCPACLRAMAAARLFA